MSAVAPDRIPTSRVGRSAKVGRLAATEAAKQFGTRAANLTRSQEAAAQAMGRRQLETAKQIVAALGTMKGAAMKLGQVMSFLDVGLVPEEFREEFQRELGKLRDAAPTVSLKEMQKVIEADLGERVRDVFSEFDPEPIAAASIGQVYHARLADDGREVAVKVQYPGVASAVRADMQNLGMILRLMKRLAPGLDAQATAQEVRERINEELDYELEAQNQRRMARIYRGHPFIHVPQVITSLSHERVLVSEYVTGTGFDELKGSEQAVRDRVAEIVFRFFYGSMYRHLEFSGDPHPGNFMLMADGRVVFLDFGLFKRIDRSVAELELAITRLVIEGDAEGLLRVLTGHGFLSDASRYEAEAILNQLQDASWWYTQDGEVELYPEVATQVLLENSDPRSRYFDQARHETLPPEHIFGRRLEMLTLAVMSQLRARANWHRIAREWIYGDPPVTELGRQEAQFLASAAA